MRPQWSWTIFGSIAFMVVVGGLGQVAVSQQHGHGQMGQQPGPTHRAPAGQPSIRITSKELHMSPGGVPKGWNFAIPHGDPRSGRELFVKFECYKCHAVKGETFPAFSRSPDDVGPDLTGMGDLHPAEFFAQAILDPNAVILDEPGYTGHDGRSKMPDFTDSMTVRELINVVAYMKALDGHGQGRGASPPAHGMPHGMPSMPTKSHGGTGHGQGQGGR